MMRAQMAPKIAPMMTVATTEATEKPLSVERREDEADEEAEPGAGQGAAPRRPGVRVSRPVTRSSCLRSVPTMRTFRTGNSWSER